MSKKFNNLQSESAMTRNVEAQRGRTNNYLEWNLSVFDIEADKGILDIGSGPGMYFDQIMKYCPSVYVATDYSGNYIDEIKKLFNGRTNCQAIKLDITDSGSTNALNGYAFDYVLLFDVLEHIEDDKKALENVCEIMNSCNTKRLFVRVPAFQSLYGVNDKAIGHYRRYSKESLRKLVESCSLKVDMIRYQNIIGIIPWYVIGKVFKRTLAVSKIEGNIFNILSPALKSIENIIPPPVGLSVYCACTLEK